MGCRSLTEVRCGIDECQLPPYDGNRRVVVAEARVDEFGRIVIPKAIRTRLGLERGSVLEIDELGDGIVLRPGKVEPPLKMSKGVLVYAGAAAGDLAHAVELHRDERLRSAAWARPSSKR
jgi:AbrB family looped-hinge helix DNA binding protein